MKKGNKVTSLIIVPITEDEKEYLKTIEEDKKNIYTLYRRPNKGGIRIKNIQQEENVTCKEKAFFYGSKTLEELDLNEIMDRPIYKVYPHNRTIESYEILNDVSENTTDIWLDNIINGNYKIEGYFFPKIIKKQEDNLYMIIKKVSNKNKRTLFIWNKDIKYDKL